MTQRCDVCGENYAIGEWYRCPHGRVSLKVIADSIIGGLTIHNLGPTPVTVFSHSERRAIMKARGLVEKVEHMPGDRYVGRMV